ncbi:hypothetical protein ZWY2020_020979 [Hordeum vulgare]|nr:hypothetical protein ZWY2020_020979 [Hordeum vulgare]
MPNDKDPMPLNGNPHPLPGELEQNNMLFALPPYPALGWKAVPPPPPPPMLEPPAQHDDGGWGWHLEAPVEEPAAPKQDQESMVIDQPTSSDSVQEIVVVDPQPADAEAAAEDDAAGEEATDDDAVDAPTAPNGGNAAAEEAAGDMAPKEEDAEEEAEDFNPLAIVPYQQPLFRCDQLMIRAVRVAYGPPLPPTVSWTRSFQALMGFFTSKDVPGHLAMPAAMPIVLPKRSWSLAFDEDSTEPRIIYHDNTPVPAPEVTASSDNISASSGELFSFETPAAPKQGPRKKATPIVDSSVHRCTRGSIKRDGFKPVLQELPMHVPKKRKPRAKPLDTLEVQATPSSSQEEALPPATPVHVIQAVGHNLGIAPEKLSEDRLMEDPDVAKRAPADG